jgi:uncharacterized membrane protein
MMRVVAITALAASGLFAVGCQRAPSKGPAGDGAQAETEAYPDATAAAPQAPAPVSQQEAGPMLTPGTREPIATFTARGNEPFWSVQVEGDTLAYTTPELQPGKVLQARRQAHAKGVTFSGQDAGSGFALDIQTIACEDTMSGEPFEFTATFKYGDETVTGCARRGL